MPTPKKDKTCETAELEKTLPIKLTLQESGTLCHLLMRVFMDKGTAAQPAWALELYAKLAEVNDKLMSK